MNILSKLKALREQMQLHKVAAFIVYNADPHMSEYLPEAWKEREWLSGFTGSAGLVVVTLDKAGLWTDSRYFVQANEELKGSDISLFKQGIEGTPDYVSWLKNELPKASSIAINGLCCAHDDWKELESKLSSKNIIVKDLPLLAKLWNTRNTTEQPIFIHKPKYSGQSISDKLAIVRNKMIEHNTDLHIISSLDDIAWILNLRGSDIEYNPVFLSYLLISKNNATLFIDTKKCGTKVKQHLAEANVQIKEYEEFLSSLDEIRNKNIWIAMHSNQSIFEKLQGQNSFFFAPPPSQLLKSIKNTTEIEGMQEAMLKDGIALVHFLYWLKKNVGKIALDEHQVGEKLLSFRAAQKDFKGASFGTIAGYNENGALVHYSAKKGHCKNITKEGVLLLDSGGQYLQGTTDITRTIPLSEINNEFKRDYTLVLKGMIALSLAKFPKGTRGCNLDAIARQPLWNNLRNYGHGTGHGVGCFLNVHEGPQSIRQELKEQALFPGMISSNEPGLYREGKYGIRHENLMLCTEIDTNEFGTFYKHETLTLCPFFTSPIIKDLLTTEELTWLNDYHKTVFKKLSPALDQQHSQWLKEICKEL